MMVAVGFNPRIRQQQPSASRSDRMTARHQSNDLMPLTARGKRSARHRFGFAPRRHPSPLHAPPASGSGPPARRGRDTRAPLRPEYAGVCKWRHSKRPGRVILMPDNVRGTPMATLVATDPALGSLSADQMFASMFKMNKASFKNQPATVVLNDCAAACTDKLLSAWQPSPAWSIPGRINPGKIIWVEGDMTIESDLILGSAEAPVLIMATGNINLDAASVVVSLACSTARRPAGTTRGSVTSRYRARPWPRATLSPPELAAVAQSGCSNPACPEMAAIEHRVLRSRARQLEGLPVRRAVHPRQGGWLAQRGVSLVEAIVAMAVMAFGMMAGDRGAADDASL